MASLVKIGGRLHPVEHSTRFVWQTHSLTHTETNWFYSPMLLMHWTDNNRSIQVHSVIIYTKTKTTKLTVLWAWEITTGRLALSFTSTAMLSVSDISSMIVQRTCLWHVSVSLFDSANKKTMEQFRKATNSTEIFKLEMHKLLCWKCMAKNSTGKTQLKTHDQRWCYMHTVTPKKTYVLCLQTVLCLPLNVCSV